MQTKNNNFLNNVETLRSKYKNEIKIGDLEKQLKVSPGYFSRLGKSLESLPSLDVVIRTAEFFGVSVDFLLVADINAITETEKLVLSFINKVRDDTIAGNFKWKIENQNSLCGYMPIIIGGSEELYGCEAYTDGFAEITRFNDKNLLKVIPCKFEHEEKEYKFCKLEMINDDTGEENVIADGGIVRDIIQKALNELYISILHGSSGIYISNETKCLLNEYLNQ